MWQISMSRSQSASFILKIHNTNANLTAIDLNFYLRTFRRYFFLDNSSFFTDEVCSFPPSLTATSRFKIDHE